jgi:hypothetical protein
VQNQHHDEVRRATPRSTRPLVRPEAPQPTLPPLPPPLPAGGRAQRVRELCSRRRAAHDAQRCAGPAPSRAACSKSPPPRPASPPSALPLPGAGALSPGGGASNLSDSYDYDAHLGPALDGAAAAALAAPQQQQPAHTAAAGGASGRSSAGAAAADPRRSTQALGQGQGQEAGPAAAAPAAPPFSSSPSPPQAEYNALAYRDLAVPPEVRDLFALIGQWVAPPLASAAAGLGLRWLLLALVARVGRLRPLRPPPPTHTHARTQGAGAGQAHGPPPPP